MRGARLFLSLFFLLCGATGAMGQHFCSVPPFPKDQTLVVMDDGNNLRQWGGANYAQAPVLEVLNTGSFVRLIRQDGRWAEVETENGRQGFINAKCLAPYHSYVTGKSVATPPDYLLGCDQDSRIAPKHIDLDGDGKPETLRLTCEPGIGCTNYFLDVLSADGRVLFSGPRHGSSFFLFCSCHSGVYLPEVFADIDGDGRKEMILLHPRSDVSPTAVEIFRFNGAGFDHVVANKGFFASKEAPDLLRSTDYPAEYPHPFRFLYTLHTDKTGNLIAGISGEDGGTGEAQVRYTPEGFRVVKWVRAYARG